MVDQNHNEYQGAGIYCIATYYGKLDNVGIIYREEFGLEYNNNLIKCCVYIVLYILQLSVIVRTK